jgi:hypothetical protein
VVRVPGAVPTGCIPTTIWTPLRNKTSPIQQVTPLRAHNGFRRGAALLRDAAGHQPSSRKGRLLATARRPQTSEEVNLLQTLISHRSRDRQPRRRRYQKHQRAGAIQRAFAGAKMVLGLPIQPKDQATAADLVASTPAYIRAATTLLEAEDSELVDRVLWGNLGLLEAARLVRKRVRLVKAYREADRNDRKALGKAVGVNRVFDDSIAPLL